MFTSFFVNRPIFACVISIVIVMVGLVAFPSLPIEQTPDITPPTINVRAMYPGASAKVIAETVAIPLEQEINGIENILYITSKSSADGTLNINITFDIGIDIDIAAVLVQNRVARAEPKLPEEVKRLGVTTQKQSTNIVLVASLLSPESTRDELFLSNYANIQIVDVLKRVEGVGGVTVFGEKNFSMRVWLDPEKLKARSMTVNDVMAAVADENIQVAAGIIGAPPSDIQRQFQYTINTKGRLSTVEEFENIIIKADPDGRILRLKDIARIELGSEFYNTFARLNGAPTVALGIYQLPGANAIRVAKGVRAELEKLSKQFPSDMTYTVPYDPTQFITASAKEVIMTLLITMFLVILTVYIFLQDIRTTLIPAITIPVSLIGTMAVMLLLGSTINMITLFGLLLAIGVVVDDSIVVVENTLRIMDEDKVTSKEAAIKSMQQIIGPVIATTLVLLAVFVPTAMISGVSGRLYRQFAITISTATVFSTINALTLSPALCGMLLRQSTYKHGAFFRFFNKVFGGITNGYISIVKQTVRRTAIMLIIFIIFGFMTLWCFENVPGGFLPNEDQGILFVSAELPSGATLERTAEIIEQITEIMSAAPEVENIVAIGGYSLILNAAATNTATFFVDMKNWDQRKGPQHHIKAVQGRLQGQFMGIQDAIVFGFVPPPIFGLGLVGGFEMQLQDRSGEGLAALQETADNIVYNSYASSIIENLNTELRANVPQLELKVDREKAKKLGVPIKSIFDTLQTFLGSAYVNDFNLFGRIYKVNVQADSRFRSKVSDISKLQVRNAAGEMVPLSTLITVEDTAGPQVISHFNLYPSTMITGQAKPGMSTSQAIEEMQAIASSTMPESFGYEWSGMTFQQLRAGNTAPLVFFLAVVFVLLFLAAQYESWAIPFAIVFTVPIAILGGIGFTWVRGMDNNIYTQIGFVLLIALASKNAILLVEFAHQLHDDGMSIYDSAIKAARQRFRPIQMTALTFVLGVLPLIFATGAGSASRVALGTVVFGGMVMASVIGIIFVPAFYELVQKISDRLQGKKLRDDD